MKKCKLALVGLLLVLSMGVLVACGNEAGTILEDAGRGVEDLFSGNAEEQMTDSTLEQTMPR